MSIIDPKKLEEHRSVIDDEVAILSIQHSISRPQAYALLANNLGFFLRVWLMDYEWVSAAAVPLHLIDELVTNPSKNQLVHFCELATNTECRAIEPDDAAVACILRCLDKQFDVYHDVHRDIGGYDDIPEWDRLFAGGERRYSIYRDPEQQALFETDAEYEERKLRLHRAAAFDSGWDHSISRFESRHTAYFNGGNLEIAI